MPSEDYKGDVDLFGVYCPEIDKVFLLPAELVKPTENYLRVQAAKRNDKRIRWATDFEITARSTSGEVAGLSSQVGGIETHTGHCPQGRLRGLLDSHIW